ncbi:MAG: hypothetical protein GX189_10220 [Clostridiales bacterium]|nr:hypothetical protein [Clostridiales bacterium]
MKKGLAFAIRVLTIAPVMALVLLLALFFARRDVFGNTLNFALAVIFLVVFPILAYPLQPVIPRYKTRGREGQRSLAMLMAFLGYVLGLVCALLLPVSRYLLVIYMTYLLSALILIALNKVFGIKASGHACGVSGPIFSMVYFISPWILWGLLLLPAVYWASLKMGRHTGVELVIGTAIPTGALLISILIFVGRPF